MKNNFTADEVKSAIIALTKNVELAESVLDFHDLVHDLDFLSYFLVTKKAQDDARAYFAKV